jgi:hypothetical protein
MSPGLFYWRRKLEREARRLEGWAAGARGTQRPTSSFETRRPKTCDAPRETADRVSEVWEEPGNANDHEQKARVHPASPIVSWSSHNDGTLRLDIVMA